MKRVYIVTDDRTNVIVKAFSNRKKAAAFALKQQDPKDFVLRVFNIE